MSFLEQKIYKLKPVYLCEYEDLIKSHTQFGGGSKDDKYIKGKSFSNVYEFYIYSFFIGLDKDIKVEVLEEDKVKSFWEIENWKPRELVDVMISISIAKSNMDMSYVENCDENDRKIQLSEIKKSIEGYANGGLKFIKQILDEDPDKVDDDLLFVKLIAE